MRDCKDCRLTVASAPATAPPPGDVDVIIDPSTFFGLGLGGGPSGPPLGTPDAVVDLGNFYSLDSVGTCLLTYRLLLTSYEYVSDNVTSFEYVSGDVTSTLYPIEAEDGMSMRLAEPSAGRKTILKNFYADDSVGVGLLAPAISRQTAVRYLTYSNVEDIEIGLLAPNISRRSILRTYDNAKPEAIGVGLLAPDVSRRQHPVYRSPAESISVGLLAPAIKRTNT